jgi:hypothetical protein
MKPYLTVVVAARNDNYGGNFLERTQTFLDVLISLAGQYSLPAELIVIEWNPPMDKVRLREALRWPRPMGTVGVRIIEVPGIIHDRMPNSDKLPMFDSFAKNVGIRRAKGSHILVTNPDVLFSEELIAALSAMRLSRDRFYRIDRFDFRGPVPPGLSAQDTLIYAKRNVSRVNVREGRNNHAAIKIGWLQKWRGLFCGRWPGSYRGSARRTCGDHSAVLLDDDNGVYGGIHTNASGDFLLAPAESWNEIRGFPEFTDTFTHLDSYGCHQLKALGLQQALFLPPCMIFHWDHSREAQKSRPSVPAERWKSDLQKIRSGLLGPAINALDWGLAAENLPEIVVSEKNHAQ